MSGIVTGLLYALKRFTYPAFTAAVFNAGIVLVALALGVLSAVGSGVLCYAAAPAIIAAAIQKHDRVDVGLVWSGPADVGSVGPGP